MRGREEKHRIEGKERDEDVKEGEKEREKKGKERNTRGRMCEREGRRDRAGYHGTCH